VTARATSPGPPPEIVPAAERDSAEVARRLDVLVAATCAVRGGHDSGSSLFMQFYASARLAKHSRLTAVAAPRYPAQRRDRRSPERSP
jgi:hypothetical protein